MAASSTWLIAQISRLLPLDEPSLKQIIDYSVTLSKDDAAEHLKNLLGDSPQAIEFITSFNARGEGSKETQPSQPSEVSRRPRKKSGKAQLNKLPPPRRPDDHGKTEGAYHKKDQAEDYMPGQRQQKETPPANALSLDPNPAARQLPLPTSRSSTPKPPPSAGGSLTPDLPNVRSRTVSPNPRAKAKVTLAGGTAMHGASSALTDLESAIRSLEMQTNPTIADGNTAGRACDCMATRHPLLAAAPNCLACGKIVCAKEGLGLCTFCSSPLLSSPQIQEMIRALREERGRERMAANNASQRRADVSTTPRPFQSHAASNDKDDAAADASLAAAQAHRDRLLGYQTQNARRTQVHDEAADFETPDSGQSMWSSPVERARQLKRQQKVLREMEWNARPEYEKRRVVVSVDLVGGKVVRRMADVEREREKGSGIESEDEVEADGVGAVAGSAANGRSGGAFGRNPLLGKMVKPVWKRESTDADGMGGGAGGGEEGRGEGGKDKGKGKEIVPGDQIPSTKWRRRVQDDNDDNEDWILDGGVYGGRESLGGTVEEEHTGG